MLRLIGNRYRCSKPWILCSSLLKTRYYSSRADRSYYVLRPNSDRYDPMTDEFAFEEFLMSAYSRMTQHLLCHIFWAAGNDVLLADRFMYKVLDGRSYGFVFTVMQNPLDPEIVPFDDCGEICIPDPRFIQHCQGPCDASRLRIYYDADDWRALCQFVCRAEKDMFAGEPNVRELQREMRLFAREFGFRTNWRLVDDICCSGPRWNERDKAILQACKHEYSSKKHARYLYWLKRAQMVADEGGLHTDLGTGFVALFNYQLKHAYKIHQKYTHYHVISDRERLIWSSFQNQKYYTIDIQGVTSKESIEVDYIPALQCLVFSAPGLKCTDFSLPAHADGEKTMIFLRDGVVTLRVPLHQPFTLNFDECKRDGHSFEVGMPEGPGVSPEDAVVRVVPSGPSLILSRKSDDSQQACYALPAVIHAQGITAFLQDDILTVFLPKVDESDYMAVSLSSRLHVLRDLLVPPAGNKLF